MQLLRSNLSKWIHEIPVEAFFECAKTRPHGLGKDDRFEGLQADMRSAIPVPGREWVHDIEVLIDPAQTNHQGQAWHAHSEWTAVFYVAPGTPAVPIEVNLDGKVDSIYPYPGDCVIMAPGVQHRVAPSKSTTPRLSFAMLVQVPGVSTRFKRV